MSVTKSTTFNATGVNDGDAVTTTNAATCGDAPSGSSVLAGLTYASGAAVHGTFGLRAQAAAGVSSFWDYGGFGATTHKNRFYYTPRALTASTQIEQARTSGGQSFGLTHNASGQVLNVLDAAGAGKGNSPALTPGTKYRIDYEVLSDAAAGTIAMHVWNLDDTTTPFYQVSLTGQNTRGGSIINDRIGKVSTSAETQPFDFDGFIASDADLNAYGPEAAQPVNQAPTDNAGADQVVDPYQIVTLTGAGTDSDGTIASYSWAPVGNSISLSGAGTSVAQFVAPPSQIQQSYTFRLTVTDNQGATATDDVVITVRPHTMWRLVGGVLLPELETYIS